MAEESVYIQTMSEQQTPGWIYCHFYPHLLTPDLRCNIVNSTSPLSNTTPLSSVMDILLQAALLLVCYPIPLHHKLQGKRVTEYPISPLSIILKTILIIHATSSHDSGILRTTSTNQTLYSLHRRRLATRDIITVKNIFINQKILGVETVSVEMVASLFDLALLYPEWEILIAQYLWKEEKKIWIPHHTKSLVQMLALPGFPYHPSIRSLHFMGSEYTTEFIPLHHLELSQFGVSSRAISWKYTQRNKTITSMPFYNLGY
jgi:hypothetical protein